MPASRKLQQDDARQLLAKAATLQVAKGKKSAEFTAGAKPDSEAVDAMLGSTGNLRAPTLVVGKKLIVGFNEEIYTSVFG